MVDVGANEVSRFIGGLNTTKKEEKANMTMHAAFSLKNRCLLSRECFKWTLQRNIMWAALVNCTPAKAEKQLSSWEEAYKVRKDANEKFEPGCDAGAQIFLYFLTAYWTVLFPGTKYIFCSTSKLSRAPHWPKYKKIAWHLWRHIDIKALRFGRLFQETEGNLSYPLNYQPSTLRYK